MGERIQDPLAADPHGVDVVRVVRVTFNRGRGVQGDPIREVEQWWTTDGHFIGERSGGRSYGKGEG